MPELDISWKSGSQTANEKMLFLYVNGSITGMIHPSGRYLIYTDSEPEGFVSGQFVTTTSRAVKKLQGIIEKRVLSMHSK